jgi:hypothetical protein
VLVPSFTTEELQLCYRLLDIAADDVSTTWSHRPSSAPRPNSCESRSASGRFTTPGRDSSRSRALPSSTS